MRIRDGALIAVGLLLLLWIGYALLGARHRTPTGGDVHAPLVQGSSIHMTTDAGVNVTATVKGVTWGPSTKSVVVEITGSEPAATASWTLSLEDNTQLAMSNEDLGNNLYSFTFSHALPAGRSIQSVHYNPDDSHGDIYFDVQAR
jgi:hypothetical protein